MKRDAEGSRNCFRWSCRAFSGPPKHGIFTAKNVVFIARNGAKEGGRRGKEMIMWPD